LPFVINASGFAIAASLADELLNAEEAFLAQH